MMERSRATSVLLVIVLVAVAFGAGYQYGTRGVQAATPEAQGLDLVRAVAEAIRTRYIDPRVDMRKVYDGAAQGMLESLGDEYTRYMDAPAYRQFREDTTGFFSGIGIYVELDEGQLTVVQPIENTPAFRAGLRAGDRIVRINGQPTRTMAIQEAVSRIRGPAGTTVRLTIERAGATREVEITRARIRIEVVQGAETLTEEQRAALRSAGVAYVRLVTFNSETAAEEFRKSLEAANRSGARGLLLDLRSNGGGLLDQALRVADLFLERGPAMQIVGRTGQRRTEHATAGRLWTKPVVVLVNEFSASASEIVAGALQDNGIQLVGLHTFGKNLIQVVVNLPGGSGAAITTEKWLTPRGQDVRPRGLQPNVAVGMELRGKSDAERDRIMAAQFARALQVLQGLVRRSAVGRAA